MVVSSTIWRGFLVRALIVNFVIKSCVYRISTREASTIARDPAVTSCTAVRWQFPREASSTPPGHFQRWVLPPCPAQDHPGPAVRGKWSNRWGGSSHCGETSCPARTGRCRENTGPWLRRSREINKRRVWRAFRWCGGEKWPDVHCPDQWPPPAFYTDSCSCLRAVPRTFGKIDGIAVFVGAGAEVRISGALTPCVLLPCRMQHRRSVMSQRRFLVMCQSAPLYPRTLDMLFPIADGLMVCNMVATFRTVVRDHERKSSETVSQRSLGLTRVGCGNRRESWATFFVSKQLVNSLSSEIYKCVPFS